jgi:GntR family transcriptional regulator
MNELDKRSSVPLYRQIQDLVYDQIRKGVLRPGEQVPSEVELAGAYDVSRMTARKALDALVSRGVLYRSKGKGTFVAQDLMSYGLTTLQSFSRTLRSRGYEVSTVVLQKSVVPATEEVAGALNLSPNARVLVVKRLRLVNGRQAAIHVSYLDAEVFSPLLDMDLAHESLLKATEEIAGLPLTYTRDSVRAATISPEDAAELDLPPGSPVLEVEGTAFSKTGQPLRFTRATYPGDLFKLVVLNTAEQSSSLGFTGEPDSE